MLKRPALRYQNINDLVNDINKILYKEEKEEDIINIEDFDNVETRSISYLDFINTMTNQLVEV